MYKVKLENFEGPLDLLLFFVRKDELNIYDIPIAHITKSYLEYLHMMQELNLDIASEFILMAATLMRIKVRCMLPPEPGEENEEEPLDPREELTRRLLEYRQFKEASRSLAELDEQWRLVYRRNYFDPDRLPPSDEPMGLKNVSFFDLLAAYKKAISRSSQVIYHSIERINVTVDQQMVYIRDFFSTRKGALFTELCEGMSKIEIVVTFLALLDMIRKEEIFVRQSTVFDDIWIQKEPIPEEDLPEPNEKQENSPLLIEEPIKTTQNYPVKEPFTDENDINENLHESKPDAVCTTEENRILFSEDLQAEQGIVPEAGACNLSSDNLILAQISDNNKMSSGQAEPDEVKPVAVQDHLNSENVLTDTESEKGATLFDFESQSLSDFFIPADTEKKDFPANSPDTSLPFISEPENEMTQSQVILSDIETKENMVSELVWGEQTAPFETTDNSDTSAFQQQHAAELPLSEDNFLSKSDHGFVNMKLQSSVIPSLDVTRLISTDAGGEKTGTEIIEDPEKRRSPEPIAVHDSKEESDRTVIPAHNPDQTIEPPVCEADQSESTGMDVYSSQTNISVYPLSINDPHQSENVVWENAHDARLNHSELQHNQNDFENTVQQPITAHSETEPILSDGYLQTPETQRKNGIKQKNDENGFNEYSLNEYSLKQRSTNSKEQSALSELPAKEFKEKKSPIERIFHTIIRFVKKLFKKN